MSAFRSTPGVRGSSKSAGYIIQIILIDDKNQILLYLFISALFFTQKNEVKLYFKNGQVLSGKADMILNSGSKGRFKDSEEDKTEKIKFDDLNKIEYFENGSEIPVTF